MREKPGNALSNSARLPTSGIVIHIDIVIIVDKLEARYVMAEYGKRDRGQNQDKDPLSETFGVALLGARRYSGRFMEGPCYFFQWRESKRQTKRLIIADGTACLLDKVSTLIEAPRPVWCWIWVLTGATRAAPFPTASENRPASSRRAAPRCGV